MISLFLLLCLYLRRGKDKLEIYINASIIWSLILLALTCFWSFLHQLNTISSGCSCFLLDLLLVISLFKKKECPLINCNQILRQKKIIKSDNLMIAGEMILMGIVFWYALKAYPYNWDSMTYHLARIVNWKQNQSVLPFATHIERQIASPVLGAYIHLWIYMLGGSRHEGLMNLLQCISWCSNSFLLFGITRRLGVEKKWAFLTPLLYIGTPIALAEATTTQVDNFAAFWLLAVLYLLLPLINSTHPLEWDRETRKRIVRVALCIGFGYLAKPSVCFAMLLLLIWLLTECIKRKTKPVIIMKYVISVAPVLFLMVLPGLIFNFMAFGTMSHSAVGQRQLIGTWKPTYIVVNFLKNLTFNFASDKVGMTRVCIEKFLYGAADFFKVDLNDPAISEDGVPFGFPGFPALSCDSAINMFLVVLILIMCLWFVIRYKKEERLVRNYSVCALVAFVVFCSVLRWERFINRYMIAYFALLAVFITIQVRDMYEVTKKTKWSFGCYLWLAVILSGSLINYYRQICYLDTLSPFSKTDGYFAYHDANREEYPLMIDVIRKSRSQKIGLVIGRDTYEYPIWGMLSDQDCEIRHIMVENSTGKYEKDDFVPDCILFENHQEDSICYLGQSYYREPAYADGRFGIYFKE